MTAPALPTEFTTDFSYGMVDGAAPTAYPKTSAALIINGRIEPDATARRRPGSIRTSGSPVNAGTCYGGRYFVTAAGVGQIVAIFGSHAYHSEDLGATWTSIATGLRQDYYSFAFMRVGAVNYLYMANGDMTIKKWDGTTWGTVSGAPPGVKYVASWNQRLMAAGHSGVLVQGSKIADPETWSSPDGMTIQVAKMPTALFVVGPHLLIPNEDETAYADGFGVDTLQVETGPVGFSRSVGCIAFRTFVAIGDNGCCWLSKRGLEYYTPSGGITLISRSLMTFQSGLAWQSIIANPGVPCAEYDAIRQNVHLAVTTDGSTNDRVAVFNVLDLVQYQRPGPRAAAAIDMPYPGDGAVLLGVDSDGYLTAGPAGSGVTEDVHGYLTLAGGTAGGYLVIDSDGYLVSPDSATNPQSLFIAPDSSGQYVLYSGAEDGYVRCHSGVDKDDVIADGSGGTAVLMRLRSRPYLGGNARQTKRVRAIHVASIQATASTLTVFATGRGQSAAKTIVMPATNAGESARKRAICFLDSDAPQVEVQTADDVKVSLLGVSFQLLRERA